MPIAKSDLFCLPQHIEAYGRSIFAALARDQYLAGLRRRPIIERLAHHLAEINALHPFREGNGRTQRAFFRQLAADAGYRLDWRRIDPERNSCAATCVSPSTALAEIAHSRGRRSHRGRHLRGPGRGQGITAP